MDKWKAALDGSTHKSEIDADKKAGNDDGHQRNARVPHRRRRRAAAATSSTARRATRKFRKLIERALAEAK